MATFMGVKVNKPYLIMVNGVLWDRKLTKHGAVKVIELLQERGLNAVLAYEVTPPTLG
jgi:hypothetical protein